MATRIDPNAKATRAKIIDAGSALLASNGYHAANIDDIAKRSGVSKGGFYFHFPSKEHMMMALVEELGDKLVSKVERAMADEPRADRRLAIAVTVLMRTFASQRRLAQVVLINVAGQGKSLDKKFLPLRNKFAAVVERELDAAVAQGLVPPVDTKLAARVWLGGLNEVIYQWLMAELPAPIGTVVPQLGGLLFQSVGLPFNRFEVMPTQ